MHSATVKRIIRAYDDPIVRAYCWVRFGILRQRFLDEIGQYLPARGRVLDVGCGFGLFSLYYATTRPGLTLEGLDRNARRIEMARAAAARLGLANVRYEVDDARQFRAGGIYDAAYMLDIVHHIPPETVKINLQIATMGLQMMGLRDALTLDNQLSAPAHVMLREELRKPLDDARANKGIREYLQMRDGPFQPEPFGPRSKKKDKG